ncbi:glycosyltransferase family 4 protein [Solirubrobacter ginsenosidimutans]|uniref:Glycosyltransferase family 4 protein n=1 Tax=Solirubrobacter ginsenosidimutans TaxID=490573 RepID=A0A9X3S3L0_9ACTN|nr:glycosyltransferase family 1 protein [Solirubrobacter ginsenosidimutans]MDA0164744.1 glycosyltransferase family 4 protein [Solirubrobacter ginsenosidimutans]
MNPRRVGLNVLYLVPGAVGGTETYARLLIGELAKAAPETEFFVFCGTEAEEPLRGQGWPANTRLVSVRLPSAIKPLRIATELSVLPVLADRHRVDILHSLGTTSPPASRAARVVTVHDLIYDRFPGSFSRAATAGLRLTVPLGARRAQRVIADSEATATDVRERLRVAPERIDVVPLGLGAPPALDATPAGEVRSRFELGDADVVLCVSAALPHKNLGRLLEGFAGLSPARRETSMLVVAGHAGRTLAELQARAAGLGIAERVRFTGWISDADLEGLYALASAFVYPSLLEGFGLPVLEAMRRSVPVGCSTRGSLEEVAGDAALTFDPLDPRSIAAAIEQLLADPGLRATLIERGIARAATFRWEATAAATLASYERALTARRG